MNIYFVIVEVFCKVEHISVGRALFSILVHLLKCCLVAVLFFVMCYVELHSLQG